MAGLPPLSGFWAKDEILVGALENRAVFALLLLSLPVTAMYMTRLFILTFLGQPKDDEAYQHAHESPLTMTVPLILLGVLTVFAGFIVLDQVGETMGFTGGIGELIFLEEAEHFHLDWKVALGSSLLVLTGIAAGWFAWVVRPTLPVTAAQRLRPVHVLLVNKFYIDDIYQWIIDRVVLAGARVVSWVDRNVVNDTGINGPAEATSFTAYMLKFTETGKLPNYALAMIIGIVAIAAVAFSMKG
jgi:NADH-quinone oxidoreductase subunit L